MSACGGVPSDSVATVADSPILTSSFNHWAEVSARTQGGAAPNAVIPVYTPPDFKECVAQKTAAGAKSKKPVTPAAAKSECQAAFDQTKQPVMQLLITSQWIDGQASAMGIKITDEQVNKKLAETKKQAFPTEKGYQDFLKSSGETEADIKARIKVDLQSQAIRDQIVKSAGSPSSEEVDAYFKKNQDKFGTPEQRTYNMILAADMAKAEAAKKALEGGASFKDVAKQYSTDTNTKNNGGLIKNSVKGQQDPSLDKAAFGAQKGVIVGPIKGSFGYYVIRVGDVKPGTTPPIEKVRPQILSQLKSEKQQQALQDFVKEFQEKWKKRTECAKYYVMELCNNAPKQPAGQQQGVPTQGAPPQGAQTTQQTPPQGG